MPNTTIGADAALARLVAAVEAETGPDWDCNSYHPSLWSALDVARAALAAAAQPAPIGADALAELHALADRIEETRGHPMNIDPRCAAILRAALASAAPPEREPHPPHRDCGCAECAPSFEPDTPKAAPAATNDCTRSHPHEAMSAECQVRAVIAEMRSKEAFGAEATEHELGEMADRLTQALVQYDAARAAKEGGANAPR